jgi:cytochrome P450
MLLLLERPEILEKVGADRSLLRPLMDESLRLESPVQWLERRAVSDTELAGTAIPEGSLVILLWASGNRDEAHWEEAHELMLDRARGAKDQLAFGYGPHLCLGAPLARLEGAIAFDALLSRLCNIRLKEKSSVRGIGLHHRGPKRVDLLFDPV